MSSNHMKALLRAFSVIVKSSQMVRLQLFCGYITGGHQPLVPRVWHQQRLAGGSLQPRHGRARDLLATRGFRRVGCVLTRVPRVRQLRDGLQHGHAHPVVAAVHRRHAHIRAAPLLLLQPSIESLGVCGYKSLGVRTTPRNLWVSLREIFHVSVIQSLGVTSDSESLRVTAT